MISRSKIGFPFRFRSGSGDGFSSFRHLIPHTFPNYATRESIALSQQNCQASEHAACIAHARAPVVGTEKKSFFEVLVVPLFNFH